MTIATEALDVLRQARDLIDAGWAQGHSYISETNSYCASGAINEAARTENIYRAYVAGEASHRLLAQIEANYPTPYYYNCCADHRTMAVSVMSIPHWNDRIAKSKDEVLAMFDKAIAQVEESL